jgi:hypothetical protein
MCSITHLIAVANTSSALIILYESCLNSGPASFSLLAESNLQKLGISGLNALVSEVVAFSTHIQVILPFNIDQASPLVANCLYRMALRLTRNPKAESEHIPTYIKDTLRKLGDRWRVASKKADPDLHIILIECKRRVPQFT